MVHMTEDAKWHWAEGNKHALEAAKAILLVNGAAAIATLTFIGNLSYSQRTHSYLYGYFFRRRHRQRDAFCFCLPYSTTLWQCEYEVRAALAYLDIRVIDCDCCAIYLRNCSCGLWIFKSTAAQSLRSPGKKPVTRQSFSRFKDFLHRGPASEEQSLQLTRKSEILYLTNPATILRF